MPANNLTPVEKTTLLEIAREAIVAAVHGRPPMSINHEELSTMLRADGASFVTLTVGGDLRGCIGALEAYQPLADDVQEHALAAALEDFRFPPVQAYELNSIKIEISRLTEPFSVPYEKPEDLINIIRPHVDGVIIREGRHRATFLPQVWEKLPDPKAFLSQLCLKMGAPSDYWARNHLEVSVYQVEEFHE